MQNQGLIFGARETQLSGKMGRKSDKMCTYFTKKHGDKKSMTAVCKILVPAETWKFFSLFVLVLFPFLPVIIRSNEVERIFIFLLDRTLAVSQFK